MFVIARYSLTSSDAAYQTYIAISLGQVFPPPSGAVTSSQIMGTTPTPFTTQPHCQGAHVQCSFGCFSHFTIYPNPSRIPPTPTHTPGDKLFESIVGEIIIIIIIKKGQQCKAGRESYTPYQSEDPSPTIPTYRQKEEKGKESRRLQQGQSSLGQ